MITGYYLNVKWNTANRQIKAIFFLRKGKSNEEDDSNTKNLLIGVKPFLPLMVTNQLFVLVRHEGHFEVTSNSK